MARNPIEIPIASETKAFRQGVESGIIEPLEDAEKALDDLGRSRGPEQLERALEDAQDETKRLERETKDTARAIEREYADAYRDMRRSSTDATDAAKEGFDEVKRESASTAKESAASFDGSAGSIVDVFQEIAANAFAGFGPAGLVAGLAAAAGIGAAVAGFEQVGEAEEESRRRAAAWAQAFIDAGQDIISSAYIVGEQQAIATDPDRYKEAEDNARNWGVTVSTAMLAMAGDATALELAQEGVNRKAAEYADQGSKVSEAALDLRNQWEAGTKSLANLNGEMETGRQAARNVSDGLRDLISRTSEASVEVDDLGNRVVTLPDGAEIFVDAKTGVATQNLDRFRGDVDGLPETVSTSVILNPIDNVTKILDGLARTRRTVNVDVNYRGGGGPTWY